MAELCSCGEPLVTKARGPKPTWCSRRCANKHYQRQYYRRDNPLAEKLCAECGETYVPIKVDQKWCSLRCSQTVSRHRNREARRERGRLYRVANAEKIKAYRAQNPEKMREYTRRANAKRRREFGDDTYRRRRAQKKTGKLPVKFSAGSIFARDGGLCGICGDPVDRAIKWPDSMSLSLDHIVPLVAGGEHSPENVQIAHLGCNSRKGAADVGLRRTGMPRIVGSASVPITPTQGVLWLDTA